MRTVHCRYSVGGDAKEPFRTPTPLRRRIAAAGLDVTFALQAIERGIHCADGHFALCAEFNLLPNGDSVGSIFQPQQRQDNDVFKFAEIIATRHYLYNIEQIRAGQITLTGSFLPAHSCLPGRSPVGLESLSGGLAQEDSMLRIVLLLVR